MSSPRSLRERLHEARSLLADVIPADGRLVEPVLAQIERALARLELSEGGRGRANEASTGRAAR